MRNVCNILLNLSGYSAITRCPGTFIYRNHALYMTISFAADFLQHNYSTALNLTSLMAAGNS
jgi:hypothetical protein